jgi:hypothetical protein
VLFSSGKEFGIKEAVVVFTLDVAMSGSSWKFVRVDERLCLSHVRTDLLNLVIINAQALIEHKEDIFED